MSIKGKKFTDDGWAIWIDGDDTSTIYFHDWMSPKGKSYIDVSIKIIGIKETNNLFLYVPFNVASDELEDISLQFENENIVRATFSSGCIIDYMKNEYTSEIAYNGKLVDIVHISKLETEFSELAGGTLIRVNYGPVQSYIDNDEGYFSFRLPHKSLDDVFGTYKSADSFISRAMEILTTPILSEKYGYSIRVNEARHLPTDINKKGAFHRQKLKKAVISVSVNEDYEINDANCFQIRRLEEDLYRNFVPEGFDCDGVITYQWKKSRINDNVRGKYSFYLNITRNAVSAASMVIYMILLVVIGSLSEFFADLLRWLFT